MTNLTCLTILSYQTYLTSIPCMTNFAPMGHCQGTITHSDHHATIFNSDRVGIVRQQTPQTKHLLVKRYSTEYLFHVTEWWH